jgi:hypothetical protein
MIKYNGERRKVVMMACGDRYRLKPEDIGTSCRQGETMTRRQLSELVKKYYLREESK